MLNCLSTATLLCSLPPSSPKSSQQQWVVGLVEIGPLFILFHYKINLTLILQQNGLPQSAKAMPTMAVLLSHFYHILRISERTLPRPLPTSSPPYGLNALSGTSMSFTAMANSATKKQTKTEPPASTSDDETLDVPHPKPFRQISSAAIIPYALACVATVNAAQHEGFDLEVKMWVREREVRVNVFISLLFLLIFL